MWRPSGVGIRCTLRCAACHGLQRIAYRNRAGVCYTEEEAKAMVAEKEYPSGPDHTGDSLLDAH